MQSLRLAVVDTDGCESAVRNAVKRGVWVYGYLNAGALEKGRSYYDKYEHLRLARYEGWPDEYWIDRALRADSTTKSRWRRWKRKRVNNEYGRNCFSLSDAINFINTSLYFCNT